MKAQLFQFFKRLPTTAYLYGLIAVSLAGGFATFVHQQRQIGAERVLTAQARAAGKVATHRADSLAKAYKPQAAAAVKWLTKYDTTGRHQLQVTLDSLKALGEKRPDTVRVTVTVGALATTDTTVTTCTQARLTCDEAVGAERVRTKAAQADAKLWKGQIPSAFAPWRQRAIGAIVGAAVICLKTNCLK
jgi:hypothetical protein